MLLSTIISVDAIAKPSNPRACCQWLAGSNKVLPCIMLQAAPVFVTKTKLKKFGITVILLPVKMASIRPLLP